MIQLRPVVALGLGALWLLAGCFSQPILTESPVREATVTPPLKPTVAASATPTEALANLDATPSVVLTPSPLMTVDAMRMGWLILETKDGLNLLSLDDNTLVPLLEKDARWSDFGVQVSPNGERFTYSTISDGIAEVWLTGADNWSPELVFSTSNQNSNVVIVWWIDDKHLLIELANYDHPFYFPLRSFIIDVNERVIQFESRSFLSECTLAVSPRTHQLATWCPAKENWEEDNFLSFTKDPGAYFAVVDAGEPSWEAESLPSDYLAKMGQWIAWEWTMDGDTVALPVGNIRSTYDAILEAEEIYRQSLDSFGDPKGYKSVIVLAGRDGVLQKEFTDNEMWIIQSILSWSPDKRYLAYQGECAEGLCSHIADMDEDKIVWRSDTPPIKQTRADIVWAPDSTHIALVNEANDLLIIDIPSGEIVERKDDVAIRPILWVR